MDWITIVVSVVAASGISGYILNKKLVDYEQSHLTRQKADIIAQLFAKWLKYRGNEPKLLNPKERVEYYEEITKLSFELSLWLTDEKLLSEIEKRLRNGPDSKDIGELIYMTRNHIHSRKSILKPIKKTFNRLFRNNNMPEKVPEITLWPADKKEMEELFDKDNW